MALGSGGAVPTPAATSAPLAAAPPGHHNHHHQPQLSALRVPAAAMAGFLSASQHSVSTAMASSEPLASALDRMQASPPRRVPESISAKSTAETTAGPPSPPRRVVSADGGGSSANSSWGGAGYNSGSLVPPPSAPPPPPAPSINLNLQLVPPPPLAKASVAKVVTGLLSAPKTWSEKVGWRP